MELMKILVINGPNLNLILSRNKDFYGDKDLDSINHLIKSNFPDVEISFVTTNNEGEIISKIQEADKIYDGLIINPAAFTHTSVGIRDALEICKIPKIEVHLSNLATRDNFRNVFITTPKCDGYISGFKYISYIAAVYILSQLIKIK